MLSMLWVIEPDGFDVDGDSAMMDGGDLLLMQVNEEGMWCTIL